MKMRLEVEIVLEQNNFRRPLNFSTGAVNTIRKKIDQASEVTHRLIAIKRRITSEA